MSLFNDSEVFQKERPTKATEKQETEFYLKAAQEIIDGGWCTYDVEDIAKDLKRLNNHYDNGFDLGKKFDDGYNIECSYDVDVAFCEWLDCLYSDYEQLIRDNERTWVKAHDIKPLFEKGAKLNVIKTVCHGITAGMIVYVNGGRMDEGKYWIDIDPNKKGGTVLEYEIVENCCELINAE